MVYDILFASKVPVPLGVIAVLIIALCAFRAGQAIAETWRPVWQVTAAALGVTLGDRFLVFSLFQGKLLSAGGFLLDFAALLALAYCAYRLTLARKMTSQYPWLYEQVGPFTWRQRNAER